MFLHALSTHMHTLFHTVHTLHTRRHTMHSIFVNDVLCPHPLFLLPPSPSLERVLDALGLNLENKARSYESPFLAAIFLMNNYHFIHKAFTG